MFLNNFAKNKDSTTDIGKLNVAELPGEVMDCIVE